MCNCLGGLQPSTAHPGQRCSVLCPHSPLAAHIGLPREGKCHHVPGVAGTLGASGKQAAWGAQGVARNWGCQGPGNIQCLEKNPGTVEHLGPGGIKDVGGYPGPGDLGQHPGSRGASGSLLGIKYPASSRIQGASSPPGKSGTQLDIGHLEASGIPRENLGPGWASGTWGYLGSGRASKTG